MDVGDTASGERNTYEEMLEKWALHDCSAAEDSRGEDGMRRLRERWRTTRSKPH
ncbi:hypothetical protein PF003_g10852 [Phytophthora fragariae]|nr:hypothetical protein PF003_g10852 [Phytophthora fragariae]